MGKRANEAAEEAQDEWEELFIAAIQGGCPHKMGPPAADAVGDFVDWCDSVATEAQNRIHRRRGGR